MKAKSSGSVLAFQAIASLLLAASAVKYIFVVVAQFVPYPPIDKLAKIHKGLSPAELAADSLIRAHELVAFSIGAAIFVVAWMVLSYVFRWIGGRPVQVYENGNQPNPQPGNDSTNAYPLSTRDTVALTPAIKFKDLHGNEAFKAKLINASLQWKGNGKNGILLYGEPGTGKTAFAEALAGELGLKIIKASKSSITSRFIGQSTEQLLALIDAACNQAPVVLFIDEIESMLVQRHAATGNGSDEDGKVTATFLANTERLRSANVLLIGATNFIDHIDEAAGREGRFDFKIEVPLPDFDARKGLINVGVAAFNKAATTRRVSIFDYVANPRAVPSSAPKKIDPALLDRVANRWGGFNVPRVLAAAERAAEFASRRTEGNKNEVTMPDFFNGLRDVQGNLAGPPEGAKSFKEMYLDAELHERLSLLAMQFKRVDEIEARGGSFPKGVIFYGPPGTGKTEMARVLAKESGWTFIPTNGRALLGDGELKKVIAKASSLRPSIVFIDEADDILAERQGSTYKMYTNDLLTAIDGAGGMLHDVVWIAATNDLKSFDKAALRRFRTKVEMTSPGSEPIRRLVTDWASKHRDKIKEPVSEWVAGAAKMLDGMPPANVFAILDAALNNAIARCVAKGVPGTIMTLADVRQAVGEM